MTSRSLGKAKVGRSSVRRGEIRWYTFALPDKRRPVLILSRDSVLASLNERIVVPATRTIRGIDTEVVLTADDGMPTACALNFDHVSLDRAATFRSLMASEGLTRAGLTRRLGVSRAWVTRVHGPGGANLKVVL
jgi:mRNA-degrading endonuclease toxin of MazEF toxin-antitoxin module